jgi:arginine decarboxylase-like protein
VEGYARQVTEILKGVRAMTKMYNIVDMQGNFYKIGAKGNLEVARNSDEAAPFSLREANERIELVRRLTFIQ